MALVGQTITFDRYIEVYNSYTYTYFNYYLPKFSITFVNNNNDPCAAAVVTPSTIPTVYLYYMQSYSEVMFPDFTDSVSDIYGAGYCGSWTYSWDQSLLSP
jgi:hypothetical protein